MSNVNEWQIIDENTPLTDDELENLGLLAVIAPGGVDTTLDVRRVKTTLFSYFRGEWDNNREYKEGDIVFSVNSGVRTYYISNVDDNLGQTLPGSSSDSNWNMLGGVPASGVPTPGQGSGSDLWKGTWSAGDYNPGDVVSFNSGVYICVAVRIPADTDTPEDDTASWVLISARSDTATEFNLKDKLYITDTPRAGGTITSIAQLETTSFWLNNVGWRKYHHPSLPEGEGLIRTVYDDVPSGNTVHQWVYPVGKGHFYYRFWSASIASIPTASYPFRKLNHTHDGTADPTASIGEVGDLYVNHGATPGVWFKVTNSTWMEISGGGGTGTPGAPGDSVEIQYSTDNTSSATWENTPPSGVKYIRFRIGSGGTWGSPIKFVGDDGDSVEIQYSVDNSTWVNVLPRGVKYIRFRVGSSGNWTTGVKFVGDDGADGAGGANVADWAEDGNTDDIPVAKIPSGQELIQLLTHNPVVRVVKQGTTITVQMNDGTTRSFDLADDVQVWARAGDTSIIPANKLPSGGRGADGDSVEIQYSADNSTWVDNPPNGVKYIRFRVGSSGTWNSVKFVGDDGQDGQPGADGQDGAPGTDGDSVTIQYSVDGTGTGTGAWRTTLGNTHRYIRFRIGSGQWSIARRFVGNDGRDGQDGSDGADGQGVPTGGTSGQLLSKRSGTDFDTRWINAPSGGGTGTPGDSVEIQYSEDGSSNWVSTLTNAHKFIRFRIGSSGNWSAGVQFVGDDGTDGQPGADGTDGNSVQIQYSTIHNGSWVSTLNDTHKFIRFSVDNGGTWTTGVQFVGDTGRAGNSVQIQYSAIPNGSWVSTLNDTHKFIRFSVDEGRTWTTGVQFVGNSGVAGQSVEIEYSVDGTGTGAGLWASTLTAAHRFIRFRIGSSGNWSAGVKFVGTDGADGTDGEGVPSGGTTGQILSKTSATDYDTEWIDPAITDMIEGDAAAYASAQHHHYSGNPYRYEAGNPIAWDDARLNLEGITLNTAKTRFICPKGTYLVVASHFNRDVHQEFGLFANFGNGVHSTFGSLMGRAVTTGTADNSNHPHSLYGIVTFDRDDSEISLVPSRDMHSGHDSINIGIVKVDGGIVGSGDDATANGFMSSFRTNHGSVSAGTNIHFNPNSLTGDSPTFNSNHTLTLPAGKYTLLAFMPSAVSNPQNVGNDALFQWHREQEGGSFTAVGLKGTANNRAVVGFGYSRTASYVVDSDSRITVALRCEASIPVFEADIGIVIASTGGVQGVRGEKGEKGEGVPTGGIAGQVLAKSADDDFSTHWVDAALGGAGGTGAAAYASAQHHRYPTNTYNYVAGNPIVWDDENQNLESITLNTAKTRFVCPKGTYMVVASHENLDEHQEYRLFASEEDGTHEAFGNRMGRTPADGSAGTPSSNRPATLQGVVTFEQETGGEISLVPSRSHNGHHDSINIGIVKVDTGSAVVDGDGENASGFMSNFRLLGTESRVSRNDNLQLAPSTVSGDMPTFNTPAGETHPRTFTLPPGKYALFGFVPTDVNAGNDDFSWYHEQPNGSFESIGLPGTSERAIQAEAEEPRTATAIIESSLDITLALRWLGTGGSDDDTSDRASIAKISITVISTGGGGDGAGVPGEGVPLGGEAGQILAKTTDDDYDTNWINNESVPAGGDSGQVLTKNSNADFDASWEDLRPGANSLFSAIESSNDIRADNVGGGGRVRWSTFTRQGDAIGLNTDRDIITLPPGTYMLVAHMPAYTLNEDLYQWHLEPSGNAVGSFATARRGHVETRLPRAAVAVLPHSTEDVQVSLRAISGHDAANKITVSIISKGGSRGQRGEQGEGVPTGGEAGQILAKTTDNDFETTWIDAATGGGGGQASDGFQSTFRTTGDGELIPRDANIRLASNTVSGDTPTFNTASGETIPRTFTLPPGKYTLLAFVPQYADAAEIDAFSWYQEQSGGTFAAVGLPGTAEESEVVRDTNVQSGIATAIVESESDITMALRWVGDASLPNLRSDRAGGAQITIAILTSRGGRGIQGEAGENGVSGRQTVIFAENSGLSASNLGGYQWSFANGETGGQVGVFPGYDAEITGVTVQLLSSNIPSGNTATLAVHVNRAEVAEVVIPPGERQVVHEISPPIPISAESLLQLRTKDTSSWTAGSANGTGAVVGVVLKSVENETANATGSGAPAQTFNHSITVTGNTNIDNQESEAIVINLTQLGLDSDYFTMRTNFRANGDGSAGSALLGYRLEFNDHHFNFDGSSFDTNDTHNVNFTLSPSETFIATQPTIQLGLGREAALNIGDRYFIPIVTAVRNLGRVTLPTYSWSITVEETNDSRIYNGLWTVLENMNLWVTNSVHQIQFFDGLRKIDKSLLKYACLDFQLHGGDANHTRVPKIINGAELLRHVVSVGNSGLIDDNSCFIRSPFDTRDAEIRFGVGRADYQSTLSPPVTVGFNWIEDDLGFIVGIRPIFSTLSAPESSDRNLTIRFDVL